MKRRLIVFAVALLLTILAATTLAGCSAEAAEETYNDNAKIVKSSSSAEVGATRMLTAAKFSYSANKFSGVKQVKKLNLPENPTFKDVKLTITGGKFKIVLVKDGEVYLLTDENIDGNIDMKLKAGNYVLKIVGVEAKVDLSMSLAFG